MDMSKILVVVKFGGALIFFFVCGTLTFFGCMRIFWTCDFGHGKFFFVIGNFWSCGFSHWKFFGHVILGMKILDMWFWACDFGYGNFLGMEKFFVMGNFWSCGNFKWVKFRIHLMRSCSTNLNLSWLALMEFALLRQSRMPLVWKWMHIYIYIYIYIFWNLKILVFYEKMMMVFFLKKKKKKRMWHGRMPLVCRGMHDFLKNLDIWGKDDFFFFFSFQNGWSMAECP